MSQALIMIAIGVVMLLIGRLTSLPALHRLKAKIADASWWLGHDPLTGMLNRIGLYDAYTVLAADEPLPIQLILIDLDNFKPVNDTHGHSAGDDLLIEIGDRITETTDLHGGIAARLAGDEFAVLLPVRAHKLHTIAELFLAAIREPVTLTRGSIHVTVSVTASIGIAVAMTSDPLDDIMLRHADIAMYDAKYHGGDQHTVYEPGMVMPTGEPRRGPRLRDLRQHHRGVNR